MKPWVKRHPYVALCVLVVIFPAYLGWYLAEHLPDAVRDWLYELRVIHAHAKSMRKTTHD